MAGGSPPPAQGQGNGNVIALLSLNILLLAFFILLNSMATFEEERRDAVMESVREAFQGLLPAERNLSDLQAGVDLFEGASDVINSLNQLFGDNLPLVESQDDSGRWLMKVDMPVADLFSDEGDALRPDGAETLRLIAGVLTDPQLAEPGYQVDVLYGLSGPASGVEGNREAMRRAGALVRELQRQGMPADHLSAGLLPDFPGQVRFHFAVMLETPPATSDTAAQPPAAGTAVQPSAGEADAIGGGGE